MPRPCTKLELDIEIAKATRLNQSKQMTASTSQQRTLDNKGQSTHIGGQTAVETPADHHNEPEATRAESNGMVTKGNNTTASEYSDIEHQPGPEKPAVLEDTQRHENLAHLLLVASATRGLVTPGYGERTQLDRMLGTPRSHAESN